MSDPSLDTQLDTLTPETDTLTLESLKTNGVATKFDFALQTFSAYKTKEVLKLLGGIRESVDVVALIQEIIVIAQSGGAQAERADAAFSAIPRLLEFAPDLLIDFAALATLSNSELEAAFDTDGIKALRQERKKLIQFHFDASVPIAILSAYIPFLGVDFLVRELGNLNKAIEKLAPLVQR